MDMIKCCKCGTFHYGNDGCPDSDNGSSSLCYGCDELQRALDSAAADNERLAAELAEAKHLHGVQMQNAWDCKQQAERERETRIKYQELAYATMNAIDSFLGLNVRRGEGTTVDSFKANLQRMLDEIKRIRSNWTNAEFDLAEICAQLKEAHQSVCSIQCLSQWKTSEGQQHSPLCRKISAALKKGPSDDPRRA